MVLLLRLLYMQARYYDPDIGRFYSNDPIGFDNIHNFNRYSYANNNPYKYVDPDGRDAVITYNKNGSIQIDISTKFSGSGASAKNIAAVKSIVSKTWSGTYSIDGKSTQVNVAITDASSNSLVTNNITLIDGPTSDVYSGGESFVDGSSSGEWRTDNGGFTNGTIAHEAGHLMGLDDKCLGSAPYPTYKDNIMGNKSGSVDSRNIKSILKSKVNWKTPKTGSRIRKKND